MIVGIDVGVTTGIALYDPEQEAVGITKAAKDIYVKPYLVDLVTGYPVTHFAVEMPQRASRYASTFDRVIQDVIQVADEYDICLRYVRPGEWKSSYAKNWFTLASTPHENDAANIAYYLDQRMKRDAGN